MLSPDFVQIYKLMRHMDDLCREAADIREGLAEAARRRGAWPEPGGVSRLVTKFIISSDLIPTSTDESAKK